MPSPEWPSTREFTDASLRRIRMPVGGIGTGCISFGGRGQLVDWELFNRPSMGLRTDSFFALDVRGEGVHHTRVLESALTDTEYDGAHGSPTRLSGLPRFEHGTFRAAYPFGRVTLSDPRVPVTARVGAFNPLIPGDAEASGLPVFIYRATITNHHPHPVTASVCCNVQNLIGATPSGSSWTIPDGNRFTVEHVNGHLTLVGRGVADETKESSGTIAVAAIDGRPSTVRTNWARRSWGDSLLDFWDDFSADGQVDEPDEGARVPTGSLVVTKSLRPGDSEDFAFVIAWHFPHRYGWTRHDQGPLERAQATQQVGNHYAGIYRDAPDVVGTVAARLQELEKRTLDFVSGVVNSPVPSVIADAALSNLAVLKSPVCFRIADGTFFGWEGSGGDHGSCHGSCTHVWNYQYALESLFGDLAWTMRTVEFEHCTDHRGRMSFRAGLPLETEAQEWTTAAADGQMGAVLRLFRTHRSAPDRDRLLELWPGVRRAMEFAWIPMGWDADLDGLMEGCQHTTADVEYFGPSGVNQSWYLAALAACVELANEVGDAEFADRCRRLLESGAALTDRELFNGEYYQQQVRPAMSPDRIAEGLRIPHGSNPDVGTDDLEDPDFQIGPGCAADQLVGHTMATLSGLTVPLKPVNVETALDSVNRYNFREHFHDHFNHLRTFALNDEAGLVNCSYPRGQRPARPYPYCNEVWTGVEYSAAVALATAGRTDAALRIVEAIRARYDGRRRNPFDEVECGRHYVRSMASWGLIEAWRE